MSLCDRWLRTESGKLGALRALFNQTRTLALAACALGPACALTFHDVPREGTNEVRTYLGSATRAPSAGESVDSAPIVVWQAKLGRGTLGALAVGDRVVASATVDRWIYAADTRTGRIFWRYRGDAPYASGPVMDDTWMYAASEGPDGRLTAINIHSGKRRWQTRLGDVPSPLSVRDGMIYGVTGAGLAFAYDAETGKPRWTRLVGPTAAGLVLAGRYAVVPTLTDTVAVLQAATGAIVAREPVGVSALSPAAVIDSATIVFSSPSGSLVAVGLPEARVRWRATTGAPVYGSPAVVGDTVFALTNGCTLWSIDAVAGTMRDTIAIGCTTVAAPAIVRGGVLVATVAGDVLYFDRAARRQLWSRRVKGELRQPPILHSGQIFVAPISGDVVSLR